MSDRARDVLDYLDWGLFMAWRAEHRADPAIEWQEDLSFNEMAEMIGVELTLSKPGDMLEMSMDIQLYWPVVRECWHE